MSNAEALDIFGKKLMASVRDETLDYFEALVAGKMKAPDDIKITKALGTLSSEQLALVRQLSATLVDNVLHNKLTMFESDRTLRLGLLDENGHEVDLVNASDGLAGELYSDEGWIARFSKHPGSM